MQVFYADGRYYIGQVKDGRRDGRGRLYFAPSPAQQPDDTHSKSSKSTLLSKSVAAISGGAPNPLADALYYQGQFV